MKHRLLSLSYDDLSAQEWVCRLRSAVNGAEAAALYTPNAEIAYRCLRDPTLSARIARGDLIAPDGEGILLGAKLAGHPFHHPKRAGVELGATVARLCAEEGRSLFLFGGTSGIAERAAARLCEQYPGLGIAGCACGYGFDSDAIVKRIRESGAAAVFVCLGSPMQEEWIDAHRAECGALLCGLGGSLDVYAGEVHRAPNAWIRLRLEWLWRGLCRPRRFWRMRCIPLFLWQCRKSRPRKDKTISQTDV